MDSSCLSFLFLLSLLLASVHVNGADDDSVPFKQNYAPLWGQQNIRVLDHGSEVQLTLDQNSGGSGFESLQKYGSGWFNMRIKMPQRDSTAVITTFYLQSDTAAVRDEIDFEFLGGTDNQERPYLLQTNIFTNGHGGREQRIYLWFDPTADFHDYSVLWNEQQLVFLVDGTPVKVFKNTTRKGGSYPTQAMGIFATIWNATWAANGAPVNWADAPFEAHYRGFGINGCQTQNTNDPECRSSKFWWNAEQYWKLNSTQQEAYENVRSSYLNYDYCSHQSDNIECQSDR